MPESGTTLIRCWSDADGDAWNSLHRRLGCYETNRAPPSVVTDGEQSSDKREESGQEHPYQVDSITDELGEGNRCFPREITDFQFGIASGLEDVSIHLAIDRSSGDRRQRLIEFQPNFACTVEPVTFQRAKQSNEESFFSRLSRRALAILEFHELGNPAVPNAWCDVC